MTPGLSSRLEKELKQLVVDKKGKGDSAILNRIKIQVHDPPRRKNAVFIGASFLANFMEDDQFISKAEYEENGVKAFHRRG
jgi:actin-related protein 2